MRSQTLSAAATLARRDPDAARGAIRDALARAGGPLVEAARERDDVVLVSFVVLDTSVQPWVRCAVFDGVDGQAPLEQLAPLPDVWWVERLVAPDVATTYQYQRCEVKLPGPETLHDPVVLHDYATRIGAASFPDPFNRDAMPPHDDGSPRSVDQDVADWESVLTLPRAERTAWTPTGAGRLEHHRFTSEVFANERQVSVWAPRSAAEDLPVVVLLDGDAYLEAVGAVAIVEQLVTTGRVAPVVVAFVHNPDELSRMIEMPCNRDLNTMLADELLPWLRREYRVGEGPEHVHLGGFSMGGLAAAWGGLSRPDAVGHVLAMSPSLWWGKLPLGVDPADTHRGVDDRPEWLTRQVSTTATSATRFWIEMGSLENQPLDFADGIDPISTSRRFRDELVARGFDVAGYEEIPGGHDMVNWRRALPHALLTMLPGARGTSA